MKINTTLLEHASILNLNLKTKIHNDAPSLSTIKIQGYENLNLDKIGRLSTTK